MIEFEEEIQKIRRDRQKEKYLDTYIDKYEQLNEMDQEEKRLKLWLRDFILIELRNKIQTDKEWIFWKNNRREFQIIAQDKFVCDCGREYYLEVEQFSDQESLSNINTVVRMVSKQKE